MRPWAVASRAWAWAGDRVARVRAASARSIMEIFMPRSYGNAVPPLAWHAGKSRIVLIPTHDRCPNGDRMSTDPSPKPLECLRPWKLFTLAVGVALLVLGALLDIAPDWDIPISFIMALLAYLTAPWSLRVL